MPRLIDADALVARIMTDAPDFMDGGSSITKAFIMAMIKTRNVAPTIDAVPVVRCKDCKYFDSYRCTNDMVLQQIDDCGCHPSFNVNREWFCADGERR